MVRLREMNSLGAILLAAVLGCAMAFGGAPPGPGPAAGKGAKETARARPKAPRNASRVIVGEYPPDFELPYLTFGKDEEGKPIGVISGEKTFRLSSFRGVKPVCMIMSSYT